MDPLDPSDFFGPQSSAESLLVDLSFPASTDLSGWGSPRSSQDLTITASASVLDKNEESSTLVPSSNSVGGGLRVADVEALEYAAATMGRPESLPEPSQGPTTANERRTSSKTRPNFGPATIKTLKQWYSLHQDHPFADSDDLEALQQSTGLNKKQILTWLANARRRKAWGSHSGMSTPITEQSTGDQMAMEIPARQPTPMPFANADPLLRWQNSPPEHEAANAADIAQAVANSYTYDSILGQSADYISQPKSRSASSMGSSGSSAGHSGSAYSGDSQDSLRLRHRLKRVGSRRRHTARRRLQTRSTTLIQQQYMYQCTFCPETYKTKHDWQRHEKTMHLSLDQWICSPTGFTDLSEDDKPTCVYCGEVEPDEQHLLGHNYMWCAEKPLRERTFFRKDHLRQHLKLVHKVTYRETMDHWKATVDRLLTRCGFCNHKMDTWTVRVEHIAAHFKAGKTMADWTGDWGFEPTVMEMIENAMPPYLIDFERRTPMPLNVALAGYIEPTSELLPSSPYELLKSELRYYIGGDTPGDMMVPNQERSYPNEFLHFECCCIVLGFEEPSPEHGAASEASADSSWLRDLLLLCSPSIVQQARLQPLNWISKGRMSRFRIYGKKSIFESCPFEQELQQFVAVAGLGNVGVTDLELQQEALGIVRRAEAISSRSSTRFLSFIEALIQGSSAWLAPFRRRCAVQPHPLPSHSNGPDFLSLDQYADTLDDFIAPQETPATQMQYSSIGGMTALKPFSSVDMFSLHPHQYQRGLQQTSQQPLPISNMPDLQPSAVPGGTAIIQTDIAWQELGFRHLTKELTRFVSMCMSPNNPNRHVPTDEELQYQARWIDFDDDDPWNQTPADNREWLDEFKKLVGMPSVDN